jgi:DNA (cytosine-5)-methyltransferase 1
MAANHRDVIRRAPGESEKAAGVMRAIDLYSGVGGWTLGLTMAGIETVASYEWWKEANRTYEANFGRPPVEADIHQVPIEAFPRDVEVVVGSPPCTQFSFANRGGNGDIADGMRDVAKFLEVVEYAQPRYWVMENVPRVAGILERELGLGGRLRRFIEMVSVITVVDMADFGLPQRRKRMLAGHFPLELLLAYRRREQAPTLGDVVSSLASERVVDPVFGLTLPRDQLRDHLEEVPFSGEEARLNRAMKQQHPFYNVMNFPDPLGRTARTVTALCTRVSRESIVIKGRGGGLRRLTLRERATLQGFPITFQFCGSSYTDKLKMVGNAIPPALTFYIGQSLLSVDSQLVKTPRQGRYRQALPEILPEEIKPTAPKKRFASDRRFRAVIPHLRFGSGMRLEMTNAFANGSPSWVIAFYFGTSKNIRSVELDDPLVHRAFSALSSKTFELKARAAFEAMRTGVQGVTPAQLQLVWTHKASGLHPFDLVDRLGALAEQLYEGLPSGSLADVQAFVGREASLAAQGTLGRVQEEKLRRNAGWIFVGLILGSWFNSQSGLRNNSGLAQAG